MEKIKFGSTPAEIDDLANKVLSGEKVATSSLLDYHLQGLKRESKVGDYFSILNSFGKEVAIVRVEKIAVVKFGNITETFAVEEGDGSLENWLNIHRPYYSKLLSEIGKELSQETLLVCEWFKVIKADPGILIREILPSEIYLLEDMLYEAIYQPDENNLIPRSVLKIPEVDAYIKDFGKRTDDYCLVADLDGKIVGAVWIRIISGEIKGFGYVDNQTPEFAISLFKEYRGQGIGTRLMEEMIEYMCKLGYKQASLSVQKENYAVKLYLKMGFEIIRKNNEDYLMLLDLR